MYVHISLAEPDPPPPYLRRVWTTDSIGSASTRFWGVLIGLSRCYVNDRPLVDIAGYRSSWLVLVAMEKSVCCLCGTALPVKTRKLHPQQIYFGLTDLAPPGNSCSSVPHVISSSQIRLSVVLAPVALSHTATSFFSPGVPPRNWPQRQQSLFSIATSTSQDSRQWPRVGGHLHSTYLSQSTPPESGGSPNRVWYLQLSRPSADRGGSGSAKLRAYRVYVYLPLS